MTRAVFIPTIERARRYQITDLDTLPRSARLGWSQDDPPLPGADGEESFRQREAYPQGPLTAAPDFSLSDKMLEEDEEEEE